MLGEMNNMIDAIRKTPQIVTCDKVSGDDCFVSRAHVRDVAEMEAVFEGIVPFCFGGSHKIRGSSGPMSGSGVMAEGETAILPS